MSLLATATFLTTPATANPFISRVTAAVAIAAVAVRAEPTDTANHEQRMRWAASALENPESMAHVMRWGVAANGTIASAIEASPENPQISDGDIQFVVNSLIDAFAP